MIDTEEIIGENLIEKVMDNRNLNNEFINCTSNIDESNNVPSSNEDNSSTCKKDIQIVANQYTDDCKVIIINNVETEQNSNKKDNLNERENKSAVLSNIEQNEIFINNSDKNQDKDIILKNLKQKKDDNIYSIHEVNTILSAQKSDKVSSLVSIAIEYGDSDSETEEYNTDEIKCDNNQSQPLKEVQNQTYRQNKEVSSSEESDTEDSSSSSSSEIESIESDSDDILSKRNKENNERQKNNKMKNELDDLPPIEDLQISVPEVLCDPLGEVAWMVKQLVVVKPKPGKPTLNLDTILFIDKGQRTLGKIFDVFGQVNEPHYCVRFNSSKHITQCKVTVGMSVYYCPNTEYTSLVFLHELLKIKGIDANADDPPEFSDDEEERVYYEQQKAKQTNNIDQTDIPSKRKRISNKPTTGWQSNHPWNRNMQNQRRGFYGRVNKRFPSMQTKKNQSQNLWPQFYQTRNEPYEHRMHSLQYMQYMNYNSGVNQNFYGSHNYYSENASYLNPRIPFNSCPRVPPLGYVTSQNHPNSSTNVRFQPANILWLPQMPQVPRMKSSRIAVPPSPPPPPPPPTSSSSNTI
ncbi:hypothetical protein K0M31_016400 [Melipona bicolor]|uniref:H/ACA ribonucleoprotein complex non-core subunit NAF1 n=1 Tax=Melipona bicolor TaxID=60889 RepID=A0AA40G741_9HYME|nr:hypothetical protein K0M31_016400 [Melipona bicolor]